MIKSSQKVFDVLEYLCLHGAAKASEVSQALDLQKSSVHRFLNTLTDIGYVRKDEHSGRFAPTLKVFQLGVAVSNQIDWLSHAKPFMRQLAEELDVTVTLATFMDDAVLVLQREYPRSGITRVVMNQHLPAYCTGLGKILLAGLGEAELHSYLGRVDLVPLTGRTLRTPAELEQAVHKAKTNGYAEDYCEISESLHCVAIPVRLPTETSLWAMSASSSCTGIQQIGVVPLVERLREAANRFTSVM